jgi:hypothetical protein
VQRTAKHVVQRVVLRGPQLALNATVQLVVRPAVQQVLPVHTVTVVWRAVQLVVQCTRRAICSASCAASCAAKRSADFAFSCCGLAASF